MQRKFKLSDDFDEKDFNFTESSIKSHKFNAGGTKPAESNRNRKAFFIVQNDQEEEDIILSVANRNNSKRGFGRPRKWKIS
jgi:hypothetical protein